MKTNRGETNVDIEEDPRHNDRFLAEHLLEEGLLFIHISFVDHNRRVEV